MVLTLRHALLESFAIFFPFNSFHNKCVIEANERQEPGIRHTDGTLTLKIGFFSVGFGENKLFFREFGLIKLRYSKCKTSSNIKYHLQFSICLKQSIVEQYRNK